MPSCTWVMQRCESERFPYRLQIIQAGKPWLTLRVQDRWPGAGQNIFCLREKEAPDDVIEEVENVPILALQRRGSRTSVMLDRARQKRCDFLALAKQSSKGSYEQIFWQTQQALRQRRPGARLVPTKNAEFSVRIASEERYPWRFPGKTVIRGRLAVGDYALLGDDDVLAVVERKTFDNLLADFGVMTALHQQLLELSACRNHSLVVESPYEDFLTPTKLPPLLGGVLRSRHCRALRCAPRASDRLLLQPQACEPLDPTLLRCRLGSDAAKPAAIASPLTT